MTTGDHPSHEGEGRGDAPENGERPSEEAIRNRLIDRRQAYERAEQHRRLVNRMREQLRPGPVAGLPGRTIRLPLAVGRKTLRGLHERPIVAFVAAAALSAVILVPLSVASFEPFPGDLKKPTRLAAEANRVADPAPDQAPFAASNPGSPPPESRFDTAEAASPLNPAIQTSRPDSAKAERLNSGETAPSENAAPVQSASGSPQQQTTNPDLSPNDALRLATAPKSEEMVETLSGRQIIDPVAAALALRLPAEPAIADQGLDPVSTGSILPSAQTSNTPTVSAITTAEPMSEFVVLSPSILIATGDRRPAGSPDAAGPNPQPTDEAAVDNEGNSASFSAPDAPAANPEVTRVASTAGRANSAVKMRATPANDGAIVAILAQGEALTVLSCKGWCEVETAKGQKGFVYETFIDGGTTG